MALSAISSHSTSQASGAQSSQAAGHHRHGGHHAKSISDTDAQSSSVASAPSSTGRIGSKLDVTV